MKGFSNKMLSTCLYTCKKDKNKYCRPFNKLHPKHSKNNPCRVIPWQCKILHLTSTCTPRKWQLFLYGLACQGDKWSLLKNYNDDVSFFPFILSLAIPSLIKHKGNAIEFNTEPQAHLKSTKFVPRLH